MTKMHFFDPIAYSSYLREERLIHDIYTAMKNPDLSVVVVTTLRIIRGTGTMPYVKSVKKNEKDSAEFRGNGNVFYAKGNYKEAFLFYNQALCMAPTFSEAAMLAYSNRSALLFKIGAFKECCIDIKTCLSMSPSAYLKNKLKQREEDCKKQNVSKRDIVEFTLKLDPYIQTYFEINPHPEVPSVSSDVKFIDMNGSFRIEAAKDIKVGSVVALEEPVAAHQNPEILVQSCHHCHKLCFNLMPCDNCCSVMFCSDGCAKVSRKQYHSVECQVDEMLNKINYNLDLRMAIRAFLKMKQNKNTTWSSVIRASEDLGSGRTVHEIYSSNYTWALLNCATDKKLLQGKMFNASLDLAVVIHHLSEIHGFLPQNSTREAAVASMARILMHLYLYSTNIDIYSSTLDISKEKHLGVNLGSGCFAFISKLPHACEPNLFALRLEDKVALVAVRPISRGNPLTINYIGCWSEYMIPDYLTINRSIMLFERGRILCRCRVCVGKWDRDTCEMYTLNASEQAVYDRVNNLVKNSVIKEAHKASADALATFNHIPSNTDVYRAMYEVFQKTLRIWQYTVSPSITF